MSAASYLPTLVGGIVWGVFWLQIGSELTYVQGRGYPEEVPLANKMTATTFVALVATVLTWLVCSMFG